MKPQPCTQPFSSLLNSRGSRASCDYAEIQDLRSSPLLSCCVPELKVDFEGFARGCSIGGCVDLKRTTALLNHHIQQLNDDEVNQTETFEFQSQML